MPDIVLGITGILQPKKLAKIFAYINRTSSGTLGPGFMVASQPGQLFNLIFVHNTFC